MYIQLQTNIIDMTYSEFDEMAISECASQRLSPAKYLQYCGGRDAVGEMLVVEMEFWLHHPTLDRTVVNTW